MQDVQTGGVAAAPFWRRLTILGLLIVAGGLGLGSLAGGRLPGAADAAPAGAAGHHAAGGALVPANDADVCVLHPQGKPAP
ncbi:MAG TPA: hypothetical protein VKY74_13000 [Chloroflexia bacterium]|nr:hypothetical protein [Chloroflexia bacterium]